MLASWVFSYEEVESTIGASGNVDQPGRAACFGCGAGGPLLWRCARHADPKVGGVVEVGVGLSVLPLQRGPVEPGAYHCAVTSLKTALLRLRPGWRSVFHYWSGRSIRVHLRGA